VKVNEVMQDWIKSANEGRLKVGKRDLTNDECALIAEVLQCVAGDLELCAPEQQTKETEP